MSAAEVAGGDADVGAARFQHDYDQILRQRQFREFGLSISRRRLVTIQKKEYEFWLCDH